MSDLDNATVAVLSDGSVLTRAGAAMLFARVQNQGNWKLAVEGYVYPEHQEAMGQAIIFFTGSVPTFGPCEVAAGACPCGMLQVTAGGYYEAVGA